MASDADIFAGTPMMTMKSPSTAVIETDVLIVGAGPAGAALAAFLAQNGAKAMLINRSSSTARTPRAHYTNPAAIECLRDLDIEYEAKRIAHSGSEMGRHIRQCETMVGKELLRDIGPFSSHPRKMGEHWENTPCNAFDLPQTESEPLLIKYASQHGIIFRYCTELLDFEDFADEKYIMSELQDRMTGHKYKLKSRYLCGADGARSFVAKKLSLPFTHGQGGGLALNVLFEADLSRYKGSSNTGMLHMCLGNETERPPFAQFAINRVIRPDWTKFLMILLAAPGLEQVDATEEEIVKRTKELLGCDPPDFKLVSISHWKVNEDYANEVSKGNIFCLGDAIHRHPPHHGLGSNTCIQDAYNLAWKLAYVLKGDASDRLLHSYNKERQPVAKQIVTSANETLRAQFKLWAHMGVLETTPEQREARLAKRTEASPEGREYRVRLKALYESINRESLGIGIEFNQQYCDSSAVCAIDEIEGKPMFETDPHYHYHRSTYPGYRLPHAWISQARQDPMISTLDLCGHGRFTLLTGIGGKDLWEAAVANAIAALPGKLMINVYSIGEDQDYDDVYWMWEEIRGVAEDGAVLIRPDRYIGWRCQSIEGRDIHKHSEKLTRALKTILGHV